MGYRDGCELRYDSSIVHVPKDLFDTPNKSFGVALPHNAFELVQLMLLAATDHQLREPITDKEMCGANYVVVSFVNGVVEHGGGLCVCICPFPEQ